MTTQPRAAKAPDLAVDVTIPTADGGALPAAMALPLEPTDGGPADHGQGGPADNGQRGPAVIVLHELLGLNTDIRRICGRFAVSGWAARLSQLHAGYHGSSPEDAWARTLEFLGRHLASNAQGRVRD